MPNGATTALKNKPHAAPYAKHKRGDVSRSMNHLKASVIELNNQIPHGEFTVAALSIQPTSWSQSHIGVVNIPHWAMVSLCENL
jgi:hypothetical protein